MHGETRILHFAAAATVGQLVGGRRERPRFFGCEHRDDILGSAATFLVTFAVCFVALGIGAYNYAQW